MNDLADFSFREEPIYDDNFDRHCGRRRTGRSKVSFDGTISDAFAADLVAVIRKYTAKQMLERLHYEIESAVATIAEDELRLAKRKAALDELVLRRAELEGQKR